uniref:Uncharacterized protein n=1 Tax=Cacopsylla melanoneura TaxID=428564 RepID=A0A8D8UEX8_9HEMI
MVPSTSPLARLILRPSMFSCGAISSHRCTQTSPRHWPSSERTLNAKSLEYQSTCVKKFWKIGSNEWTCKQARGEHIWLMLNFIHNGKVYTFNKKKIFNFEKSAL